MEGYTLAKKDKKTQFIGTRVCEDLLEELDWAAEQVKRCRSNFIRVAIEEKIERIKEEKNK